MRMDLIVASKVCVVLTMLVAGGCGSDSNSEPNGTGGTDAGGGRSGVCGRPDLTPASACQTAADCPDPSNQGRALCSNCPREALFRTCSAGQCVEYDRSGTIDARFIGTPAASGGESYVTSVIDPIMADGRRLTCANLLNECDVVNDPGLNVINVQIAEPVPPLAPDLAYISLASAHVGSDRIVLIYVTASSDGEGRILAQGCVEGLTVTSGQTTQALVTLVDYVP